MIVIRFGKWCHKATSMFLYDRVFRNGCEWTPLCIKRFRYVGNMQNTGATPPCVDAVEVVRCKECKHYIHSARDTIGDCDRNAINGVRFLVDEKWFCADGIRREEKG